MTAAGSPQDPRCQVPKPPPPAPIPPPPPMKPKTYATGPLQLQKGVYLSYNILDQGATWDIQIEADQSGPGWLGIGWSNSGKMQLGDFVVGFRDCVRVSSLNAANLPPPNGPAGFEVTQAGFYQESNGTRILRFQRGYASSNTGSPQICVNPVGDCNPQAQYYILFAGGDNTPSSCNDPYSTSSYHNEFYGSYMMNNTEIQMSNSKTVNTTANAQHHERVAGGARTEQAAKRAAENTFIEFEKVETTSRKHPLGYTELRDTYYSKPLPMGSGDIIWTYGDNTPVAMPGGKYALLGVTDSEVVDCENKSVPLSKVYNHHWIFEPVPFVPNPICPDAGLSFTVGVGAESRNSPTIWPDGYGYHVQPETTWAANIHLLKTTDLAGGVAGAKECIECWWSPEKACEPDANGTFACCYANSHCAVTPGTNITKEVYYLKYTVIYTREWWLVHDIDIAIMMAPGCSVQYNALPPDAPNKNQGVPSAAPPGPDHLVIQQISLPYAATLRFAIGHAHTGAINTSLYLNGNLLCTSFPTYGTELDVPGNELGHLVSISECVGTGAKAPHGTPGPIELKKDDKLAVMGWYNVAPQDPRILPTPAGPHLVIMSYMIMAFDKSAEFQSDWSAISPRALETNSSTNCLCINEPTCPTGEHAVASGNCGNHGQYTYYCCH